MQCCAWQHTALSLLILLNEHSAVVDRSPFAAAVPPLPPLLCLLFCVVWTVLGRLSLTPLGRTLPMMMCITNTPFQEMPTGRLSFCVVRRQWQHKKGRRNAPAFTAVDGHFCCFVTSPASYSTCQASGQLSSSSNFTWTCRSAPVKKVTPMFDFFFSLSFLACHFWMLQQHSDSAYPHGQHAPKQRMIQ